MATEIPDPQTFKQVIDCVGYSVMGLFGLLGAWQRMKTVGTNGASVDPSAAANSAVILPLQRIEKVEQDVSSLKARQEEMYADTIEHQKSMLQQQAAVFNLLIQQRSAIDKILGKMGGM